jgi:hypothetical protein
MCSSVINIATDSSFCRERDNTILDERVKGQECAVRFDDVRGRLGLSDLRIPTQKQNGYAGKVDSLPENARQCWESRGDSCRRWRAR